MKKKAILKNPCNPFQWGNSQEKTSVIRSDWLILLTMRAVRDSGRKGTKPWKELGYIRPQSNVSDYQGLSGPFHYYCLSLPQIFVALCLFACFFFRSQFKNRNCHDWNVFLLVLEDNICKNYKCATEKWFIGMCVNFAYSKVKVSSRKYKVIVAIAQSLLYRDHL